MQPFINRTLAGIATVLFLGGPFPAWSQDVTQPIEPEPDASPQEQELVVVPGLEGTIEVFQEQKPDQVITDELIGLTVLTREGEPVGSVDGLIFDSENRIIGVVLGIGGFLGLGEKHVALPWDDVDVRLTEKAGYISYSKDALEKAPSFVTQKQLEAMQTTE